MLQIHYIRAFFARSVLFLAIGLALVALVACSGDGGGDGDGSSSSKGNTSVSSSSGGNVPGASSSSGGDNPPETSSSSDGDTPSVSSSSSGGTSGGSSSSGTGSGDVNVENAIKIEFKNGSAPVITNNYPAKVEITPTGEDVVVKTLDSGYNFVISGATSNGSLKFYGDYRKGLYLNGVSITNTKGPAINIQKSKKITVHLVNGTQNFLTDAPGYVCKDAPANATEKTKGAFFSEGKLEFEGEGSLEVKGKCNHAIAVDNSFELRSGKIVVKESANDGIHVNDKLEVKGGELDITSVGDALQSEKKAEAQNKPQVSITGGKVKVQTTGIKSHGIASDSGAVSIAGSAIVQISVSGNGSKGMRVRGWVEFKDNQKTTIEASGTTDKSDPTDESNAAGIKLTEDLFVEGGELTIKSNGVDSKGINSEGDATIKDTKVDIEADNNAIKVKGILTIESGTGTIKSKKTKAVNGTLNKKGGSITITDGGS